MPYFQARSIVIAIETKCRKTIPASGGITTPSLLMRKLRYFCVIRENLSMREAYIAAICNQKAPGQVNTRGIHLYSLIYRMASACL